MNSKTSAHIIALTLLGVLAIPFLLTAQDNAERHQPHQYHHYQLLDIGTFGGPNSSYLQPLPGPGGRLLNSGGAAVGSGDTPTPDPFCIGFNFDCYVGYGFKWHDGVANELGALPGFNGLNSATGFWISDSGLTVGISENGLDPLTGGPAVEAVLWETDNSLTDLGTLGGNASSANAVNNRGQVAGEALNAIPDPYTSNFNNFYIGGATQVHAFRWTRSRGMQDLGTLGGNDSAAFSINERGQIAGMSFTNTTVNPTTGVPTLDPFLWESGKMLDLGTLGGTFGVAFALNNRGQVVGASNLAGDNGGHAFLWDRKGGMQDLGTLGGATGGALSINDAGDIAGGDTRSDGSGGSFLWRHGVMTDLGTVVGANISSQALSINSRRQIVGNLLDNNGNEIGGFLWEDGGPMADLSTLIPSNPDLQLDHALYINDRGEIAARGVFSNGDIHSFVLIPCDEDHSDVDGCDYSMVDAASATQIPEPRSVPGGTQRPPQSRRGNRVRFFGRAPEPRAAVLAVPASTEPDFTRPAVFWVSATPLTPSLVNPGGSSTSSVTAGVGTNGGGAGTVVTLSCSVQPSPPLAPTCSISPGSYTFGGTPSTLTVSTVGPSGRLLSHPGSGVLYAVWLPLIGLVGTGIGLGSNPNRKKRKLKTALLTCALFLGLAFQFACGGGKTSSGTPAGTYSVTVTATGFIPVASTASLTTLTVQ